MHKITAENIGSICNRKEIELPVFGKCYITEINAAMALKIQNLGDLEDDDKAAFDNHFIAYSLVDEQGECIFDESAIPLISQRLSVKLINELMTEIMKLNGLDDETDEDDEDVK